MAVASSAPESVKLAANIAVRQDWGVIPARLVRMRRGRGLPMPRKRLLNFLACGTGQRRDQQMSVVARRKLFRGGM